MPPDLLDLLEEIPCYYYDGCLIVALVDYRFCLTEPPTKLVLLKVSSYELKAHKFDYIKKHCKIILSLKYQKRFLQIFLND